MTPARCASSRQVRAMPAASSPKSASNSPRSPCSINRSGMPRRVTCVVFSPASAAASNTALPKPPASAASSTVSTNGLVSRALEHRLGIERFDEPHVDHADVQSLFLQARGGFQAIREQRAARQNHAVATPIEHFGPGQFHRRPFVFLSAAQFSGIFGRQLSDSESPPDPGTTVQIPASAANRPHRPAPAPTCSETRADSPSRNSRDASGRRDRSSPARSSKNVTGKFCSATSWNI